jgi:hypothetical protein
MKMTTIFSELTRYKFTILSGGLFFFLMIGLEGTRANAQTLRAVPIQPSPARVLLMQDVEPSQELSPEVVVVGEGAEPIDGNAARASEEKFDEDKVRLVRLLQLRFDRSSSAVLEAWAAEKLPARNDPPELKEEVSEEISEPSAAAAEEAKPDPEKERIAEQTKAIEKEVKQFARNVTLGRWAELGEYLRTLPEKNRNKVYLHLLQGLSTAPGEPQPNIPEIAQPRQAFSPQDVIALADASPVDLTDQHLKLLSGLLARSLNHGYVISEILSVIREGTQRLGGEDPKLRTTAAQLILDAGAVENAVEFLPNWPADDKGIDTVGLKLLAKYFDGRHAKEAKPDWLKKSWDVHQILLTRADLKGAERQTAMRRTVELSTLIDKTLGNAWLDESFTTDIDRGIEILSQLGSAAAKELSTKYQSPEQRLNMLKLQNRASESLLRACPDQAAEWSHTLTLLAEQWSREAELTRQNTGNNFGNMRMAYDRYGNFFYQDLGDNESPYSRGNSAIEARDLLDVQPSETWILHVDPALQPQLTALQAQLYLKIGEESKAFPNIEKLAPRQPEIARELVHEFIKVWTLSHDPNQERRMYNPYMYIFGYNQNAEAIPLSRSRQQRNLQELQSWVARIRQLPIEAIDENLLASAFTTCHSSAEVFQIEAFTSVFGEIQSLKPETIASLAEAMRGNLGNVWRQMRNQEANKTKRKEHEVIQEVVRGYQVALAVVNEARKKYQDDWQLMMVDAALLFDFNCYVQSVSPTTEFLQVRETAFKKFQEAADLYRQAVLSLDSKKQKTDVFDYWFYAALGSTDLGQLSNQNSPDLRQYASIRKAIDSLPGEAAETHLAKFAMKLFTRLSSVPPAAKYRFLKGGFEIVGEHPLAWEAKKSFDYYNDTVNEIKLIAELDGSSIVGHDRPFGVYVKLLHTTEMERESGGFQKYVQNQTQSPYVYNYGRPNEDYRDKFEDGIRTALGDNFEVLSVTFENPKTMRSRPDRRDGWRQTPFAYLMVQSRGPQIDRFPPLQLNLDFMDSAGYVILPIESPAIAIDASPEKPPARPYGKLSVVQTLDERQLDEGKLLLEVRASGIGMMPELDEFLDLKFRDLKVARIEDQTSSPTGFVDELDQILIQSDRSWLIELQAQPGKSISEFQFCDAKDEDITIVRQQYLDSDLVAAEPVIRMSSQLEQFDWRKYSTFAGLAALGLLALTIVVTQWARRPRVAKIRPFEMPHEINPFTVLGLLERIDSQAKLKEADRSELTKSIRDVQRHFFAPQNGQQNIELEEIAQTWVSRVS